MFIKEKLSSLNVPYKPIYVICAHATAELNTGVFFDCSGDVKLYEVQAIGSFQIARELHSYEWLDLSVSSAIQFVFFPNNSHILYHLY